MFNMAKKNKKTKQWTCEDQKFEMNIKTLKLPMRHCFEMKTTNMTVIMSVWGKKKKEFKFRCLMKQSFFM